MTARQFKNPDEMTPAEHAEHRRTGKLPESDEYRDARRKALEDAGLEPDDDGPPSELGEWTVDDHLNQIQEDD